MVWRRSDATVFNIVAGLLLVGGLSVLGDGSPVQAGVDCSEGCDAPTVVRTDVVTGVSDSPGDGDALTTERPEDRESTTVRTPTPQPDEESYSFAGSGQTATDTFELAGGLVMFELFHAESGNFVVSLVNTDTGEETGVIHVIGGDFNGTMAMNLPEGEYVFNIDTDGRWEVGVDQPRYSAAEIEPLPVAANGSDFAVLSPFEFSGATRLGVDAETDGGNVFVPLVDVEGNEVDTVVNELGPHEGSTVFVADGVRFVAVETVGEWNVTIEDA